MPNVVYLDRFAERAGFLRPKVEPLAHFMWQPVLAVSESILPLDRTNGAIVIGHVDCPVEATHFAHWVRSRWQGHLISATGSYPLDRRLICAGCDFGVTKAQLVVLLRSLLQLDAFVRPELMLKQGRVRGAERLSAESTNIWPWS